MMYLKLVRVDEMARMLQTTCLPVKVIAAEIGWRDAEHARDQFRRVMSMTPRDYRRKVAPGSPSCCQLGCHEGSPFLSA